MESSHLKQWEIAIAMEYKMLQKNGTSEWVSELPEGCKAIFFFFLFFWIIILYHDRIYYMYCALQEVVRGGGGGYKSRRQSPATLRSLSQQSQPGEDGSQRLVLHRPVRVKLRQGVGPPATVHRSRK
jgi:hypothetical protein